MGVSLAIMGAPDVGPGAGGSSYYTPRIMAVESAALIGAWPLYGNSLDQTANNFDGVDTDITYGAAGIGDGSTMASFNGTSSKINVFSAGLAALFDSGEGTLLCWYRANATRDDGVVVGARGNASNLLYLRSTATGIQGIRTANAVEVSVGHADTSALQCLAITWSVTDNLLILYLNGYPVDTDTCAAWVTAITSLWIGVYNSSTFYLAGAVGHVYLWNTPLTANQVLDVSTAAAVTRTYYPILHSSTNYDAFGVVLTSGADIQIYTRRGTTHYMENGKLIKIVTGATSQLWAAADFVDTANYDDRNVAGGVVPATGTMILFWGLHDYSGAAPGTWFDILMSRSIDDGATWSAPASIAHTDTSFSPYGPLVELPSGALLQTFYGITGTTYRIYTLKSADDGATWGTPVNIASGASPDVTEVAVCLIDGDADEAARLIAVSRTDDGALVQYNSGDGGATWALVGSLPFSSGINKDVSPWLYNNAGTIHLVYADRTTMQLKHVTGTSAIFNDVNAWGAAASIYNSSSLSESSFGYPSIVKIGDTLYITFNDQTVANNDPDMCWGILA